MRIYYSSMHVCTHYHCLLHTHTHTHTHSPSPYVYIPFGIGHRTCIGKVFAMVSTYKWSFHFVHCILSSRSDGG